MINLGNKHLCEYCLEENCGEPCRFCGFDKTGFKKEVGVLAPGSVLLGRYIVGKPIGKGGFGITYLAYDTKQEKKVALKEYYPSSLAARDDDGSTVVVTGSDDRDIYKYGMEKFFEEASLVSTFNGNPSIVSVYEFFYENDTAYFVMELLRGVSLKAYIAEHGCLPPEQTLYIADKVSNALMAAHSTNTLHRDISPDNIMLCEDGKVKLIDFGAARQIALDNPKSMSVILKQGFAPLEQYQRRGNQGPWTDLYSLGATLYYAATQRCIDDPMTRLEDDSEFQGNTYSIEPQLWEVIRHSLNIKINERYQDAFEFRAALNKIAYKPQEIKVTVSEPTKTVHSPEPVPVMAAAAVSQQAGSVQLLPPTELQSEPSQSAQEALPPTKYAQPASERAEPTEPAESEKPEKQAKTVRKVKTKKPRNKKLILITSIAGAVLLIAAAVILVFTLNRKEPEPFDIEIAGKTFSSNSEYVDLSNMNLFNADIENIAQFTNLIHVNLNGNNLTDISILAEIPTLEVIEANDNRIFDISFIGDLKKIKYVYMSNNLITDISVFSKFKSMEELWLANNRITDISPIAGNKKLTELGLNDNNIGDISALSGMNKLKRLFLMNCGITDISALSGCKSLYELDIYGNNISDLSPLDDIHIRDIHMPF